MWRNDARTPGWGGHTPYTNYAPKSPYVPRSSYPLDSNYHEVVFHARPTNFAYPTRAQHGSHTPYRGGRTPYAGAQTPFQGRATPHGRRTPLPVQSTAYQGIVRGGRTPLPFGGNRIPLPAGPRTPYQGIVRGGRTPLPFGGSRTPLPAGHRTAYQAAPRGGRTPLLPRADPFGSRSVARSSSRPSYHASGGKTPAPHGHSGAQTPLAGSRVGRAPVIPAPHPSIHRVPDLASVPAAPLGTCSLQQDSSYVPPPLISARKESYWTRAARELRGVFLDITFFVESDPDMQIKEQRIRTMIADNGGRLVTRPDDPSVSYIILLEDAAMAEKPRIALDDQDDPDPRRTRATTPEWRKTCVSHHIHCDNPDDLLFSSVNRPVSGGGWTTDHLIRHYASTESLTTYFVGQMLDPSLDDHPSIPRPAIGGKVVLRDGWISECLKQGQVVTANEHEGWTVKAAYPKQFAAIKELHDKVLRDEADWESIDRFVDDLSQDIDLGSRLELEDKGEESHIPILPDSPVSGVSAMGPSDFVEGPNREGEVEVLHNADSIFGSDDGGPAIEDNEVARAVRDADLDEDKSEDEDDDPPPVLFIPKKRTARNSMAVTGLVGLRRAPPTPRRQVLSPSPGPSSPASSVRPTTPRSQPEWRNRKTGVPPLDGEISDSGEDMGDRAQIEKGYQRFLMQLSPADREAVSIMMERLIKKPTKSHDKAFMARLDQDKPYKTRYQQLFSKHEEQLSKRLSVEVSKSRRTSAKRKALPKATVTVVRGNSTVLASIPAIRKKQPLSVPDEPPERHGKRPRRNTVSRSLEIEVV